MVQRLGALVLAEDPRLVFRTHMIFTTIYSSSSRESGILFYCPRTTGMSVAPMQQSTHAHNNKINPKKKKKERQVAGALIETRLTRIEKVN